MENRNQNESQEQLKLRSEFHQLFYEIIHAANDYPELMIGTSINKKKYPRVDRVYSSLDGRTFVWQKINDRRNKPELLSAITSQLAWFLNEHKDNTEGLFLAQKTETIDRLKREYLPNWNKKGHHLQLEYFVDLDTYLNVMESVLEYPQQKKEVRSSATWNGVFVKKEDYHLFQHLRKEFNPENKVKWTQILNAMKDDCQVVIENKKAYFEWVQQNFDSEMASCREQSAAKSSARLDEIIKDWKRTECRKNEEQMNG